MSFSAASSPTITLPKGGGAIRGIGEKFAANPVTGTGSMTIPIATSPGRSGFAPQLALSYDSGAGNGPFGLGWHLSLPCISRKTDKGLPRYDDATDSDVFVLSGSEDLVPVLVQDPSRKVFGQNYVIQQYRPRVEGLFARIERWTNEADGEDTFWRSISKDNITTWYGITEESRIADPADATRSFTWLICQSYDDKGNVVIYDYKPEDSFGIDLAQAHERNRTSESRSANRYLKRIRYGNRTPFLPKLGPSDPRTPPPPSSDCMFEVVFDYREHRDPANPAFESDLWHVRNDPFSSYRSGFEVRTYRLCHRVLMFHHFDEEPGVGIDCLVRSTGFTYSPDTNPNDARNPIFSFLLSVQHTGHQRNALSVTGYSHKSLPPVEFTYSEATIQPEIRDVDPASLENLPMGLDGSNYQWVDLDAEGLSGMLSEQAGGWFYKRNLSPVNIVGPIGSGHVEACFAPAELVAARPASGLGAGHAQFMDLAGDGQPDLVTFRGPAPGFYERTPDATGWKPFTPFASLPVLDWDDPNLKFVDLTGDGHADLLITEDDVFRWHPSLAEDGFGTRRTSIKSRDEETGPQLLFADGTQSIHLADLSGDGLSDLVRIRNGEVCYWPNLGYGRFGAKVAMDNSPWFDFPDQFDQKRIRLADIDGSGATDIIYLHALGARTYFNQSGNSWSQSPATMPAFPPIDSHTSVTVVDLLGNGTACLVWSSSLPADALRPMRYIDLMGGQKPHLLIGTVNNLGAETLMSYAPSTKFYLQDKAAGNPWITKLPFPVHVVEKVTVTDKWRRTEFSTMYSYHHGYFDGVEREFRGFGRIEQIDIEDHGTFAAGNKPSPFITDDSTLYQPPIKTVTWYHTGAALERHGILTQFDQEYFPARFASRLPNPALEPGGFREKPLSDPELPPDLSSEEWGEALRACKGMVLRQEVYELDAKDLAARPSQHTPVRIFSAATHNCRVQRLQAGGGKHPSVFLVTESEAVTYHYELGLSEGAGVLQPGPRIAHTLILRHDEYGNPQQSVAIAYGRWQPGDYAGLPRPELIAQVQDELHIAYTESHYTEDVILNADFNADGPARHHRLRMPFDVRSYELKGIPRKGLHYYELVDFLACDLSGLYGHRDGETPPAASVQSKLYHEPANGLAPQMRIVERVRTAFFDDASDTAPPDNPLPFGKHGPRGLTYEDYKLALTTALLDAIFQQADSTGQTGDKLNREVLPPVQGVSPARTARDLLGDPKISGYWTSPNPGVLPGEYWMRSGTAGFADDAHLHFFLPERYIDPFDHVTTVEYDERDLFVHRSTDAKGNITAIADAAGKLRFDYRVLAPIELVDINGNHTEACFDVLGRVIAVAVKGKGNQADNLTGYGFDTANPKLSQVLNCFDISKLPTDEGQDLLSAILGNATTRFLYHFGEKFNNGNLKWMGRPAGACTITRERHVASVLANAPSPLQIAFECSDGMGTVLMKRSQAEPENDGGPLRWIVSGKTVFNNKGKPVKQYEPYFSVQSMCCAEGDEQEEAGVTPLMYYDAPGRLIRTEMPDGTFSRVEFSPWEVRSFDANDTVLESKWYGDRSAPDHKLPLAAVASPGTRAAWFAAQHADTPAVTIFDSLGREVISIAHNRVGPAGGVSDERYLTFTKLDAEGKPLWIRDARGNLVMQYIAPPKANNDASDALPPNGTPCYDIAGNLLFQHSMDAGDRWMLMDAAGKPMFAWDFNERQASVAESRFYFTQYDALHRPAAQWLSIDGGLRRMVERFEYRDTTEADGSPNLQFGPDQNANLIGQLVRHYDPSGLAETIRRDFKGNVEERHRTLNNQLKSSLVDWQGDPATQLENETFVQITEFDALNRMSKHYNWHRGIGSRVAVYQPIYNQRGVLVSESLTVRGTKIEFGFEAGQDTLATTPIEKIRYNVKGQKEFLQLGNGTLTQYDYDPTTFRLKQIRTTRPADASEFPERRSNLINPAIVQQLLYTYDPVGNIAEIEDQAYKPVFFANGIAELKSLYEYDALYRLIWASGRETAQGGDGARHGNDPSMANGFPITDQTLRRYVQTYAYDQVGNFVSMKHAVPHDPGSGWTRHYECFADSNRLRYTWTGSNRLDTEIEYRYDTHGNMRNLLNVSADKFLRWDHRDMISGINLGGGGEAYYQYDAGKQRTRKRIERNGSGIEERIYLGGYELYRLTVAGGVVEEIESHHLFEGDQRVLLVDDVIIASDTTHPRPDGLSVKAQTLFRYQYGNHLGSACLELDHTAAIITYEEYHPYGTSAYRATKSGIEAPPKRYRYTGMERDEESGLSYCTSRYYATFLARWLSSDPTAVADGVNLFSYVHNSPIRLIDSSGTASKEPTSISLIMNQKGPNDLQIAEASEFGKNLNYYFEGVSVWVLKGVTATGGLLKTLLWDNFGAIVYDVTGWEGNRQQAVDARNANATVRSGLAAGPVVMGKSLLEPLDNFNLAIDRGDSQLAMRSLGQFAPALPVGLGFFKTGGGNPLSAPTMVTAEGLTFSGATAAPSFGVAIPAETFMTVAAATGLNGPKPPPKTNRDFQAMSDEQFKKGGWKEKDIRLPNRGGLHEHHLLPQTFKEIFVVRFNLNIEQFKIWLPSEIHLNHFHGKGLWNPTWEKYLIDPKNLKNTQTDLIKQLKMMEIQWDVKTHSLGRAAP